MKWYLKVLNQYADFEGRASRGEFWMFVLCNILVTLLIWIIGAGLIFLTKNTTFAFLILSYMFAILIPNCAVAVRRLHDVGKSGWYLLIALIPIIGGIYLITLLASKGTPEKNRYGEPTKRLEYKTEFNKTKSVAITLIIAAIFWVAATIFNYIILIIERGIVLPIHFSIIFSAGLLIVGVSLLLKKKLTTGAAYILIIIATIWIISYLFNIISSTNMPDLPIAYKIYIITPLFNIIVPISLLLFGLSEVSKIGNKKVTVILMQAGAIIWIAVHIAIFALLKFDISNQIEILSFGSKIITSISLLLLASLIKNSATIFACDEASSPISTREEVTRNVSKQSFYERDNRGMRVETFSQSLAYWMGERIKSDRKDPFVYYTFNNGNDAKMAMCELPFLHIATDSGKLISDEILRFGYFAITNNSVLTGEYDAFIAGADFTHDMWKQTHSAFSKHNGTKKNDLEPVKNAKSASPSSGNAQNVTFVRENKDAAAIWMVYKASTKADAMAFLSQQYINKRLYYVIVETPEGNFGRDIDGFYQE